MDDDDFETTSYWKPKAKPSLIEYYERRIVELEVENAQLEVENAQLQKERNESVNLACDLVASSDHMKLQLILCGALTMPRKEPNGE